MRPPVPPPSSGSKRAREGETSSPAAAAAAAGEELPAGECGAHPGPCSTDCQDPEADAAAARQHKSSAAAAAATAAAEAAAAAAAAAVEAQRQPKRRRKKLHDMSGVGSVGITARGALDKYRFNMFMRDLLGEKARDIFRSKGVLCIKVRLLGGGRRACLLGWRACLLVGASVGRGAGWVGG
jgi:hypothetical protein